MKIHPDELGPALLLIPHAQVHYLVHIIHPSRKGGDALKIHHVNLSTGAIVAIVTLHLCLCAQSNQMTMTAVYEPDSRKREMQATSGFFLILACDIYNQWCCIPLHSITRNSSTLGALHA